MWLLSESQNRRERANKETRLGRGHITPMIMILKG